MSRTGRLTFDPQICRLLGVAAATFGGTTAEFLAAVHPDDRDAAAFALRTAIEQGEPYEVEHRAVWPDTTIRHIRARGVLARDDAGRPARLDGVIGDITVRKLEAEADERFRVGFEKGAAPQALTEALMRPFGKVRRAAEMQRVMGRG
jgi:PAS domain-containing protein